MSDDVLYKLMIYMIDIDGGHYTVGQGNFESLAWVWIPDAFLGRLGLLHSELMSVLELEEAT